MKISMLVAVLALSAGVAQAAPLQWHLQDWVFDDGGIATGSYTFDADTDIFSDILITTSGGSLAGTTYSFDNPVASSTASRLIVVDEILADMTGENVLYADFASAMTNSGGSLALTLIGLFAEGSCSDSTCSSAVADRLLVSGSVTTTLSAVPLPSTLLMLGTGLLGLGFVRRRAGGAAT